MPRTIFPEFRDELESTRYPFADSASLVSDTGQELELDTFLDASLYPIGAGPRVYLSSVAVSPQEVTLTISDPVTGALASVSFDPLDPPALLRLTDEHGRPAGLLVSEPLKLSRFGAWASGIHTFEVADSEFVAAVVIPTPAAGVRGLLTEKGELLTGDVWLVGDNGVVVREDGNGDIRIDIVGDPLFARRLCTPVELFTAPVFLKTINGCPPDEQGNFNLTVGDHLSADTIVRIFPTDNGLRIVAVGRTIKD